MIKTYDFKSPKKFTKERMGTVENLYEGFARTLATYLTGLLQVYCDINVTSIEERRYAEFSSVDEDLSLFALVNLIPENKDYNEAPLVFEMQPYLGFFMIERLLGGAGTEYQLDRPFTDIEKAILKHLLGKITSFIEDAWRGYMGMQAVMTGMETNVHLLQMSAPEDVVVIVKLELDIKDFQADMHVVMPASNVEELISKFGFKYAQMTKRSDAAQKEARKRYIEQSLLESEVCLKAIFHTFQLDTQEVLQMQVGDVIPLNKNINSDVDIQVEDIVSFQAKPGHTRLRKAVQITKVL